MLSNWLTPVKLAGAVEQSEGVVDVQECKLRVVPRVIKIFHSQVAPRDKVGQILLADRTKQRAAEGTDHTGSDQIRITQNKRIDPPRIVRLTQRNQILADRKSVV